MSLSLLVLVFGLQTEVWTPYAESRHAGAGREPGRSARRYDRPGRAERAPRAARCASSRALSSRGWTRAASPPCAAGVLASRERTCPVVVATTTCAPEECLTHILAYKSGRFDVLAARASPEDNIYRRLYPRYRRGSPTLGGSGWLVRANGGLQRSVTRTTAHCVASMIDGASIDRISSNHQKQSARRLRPRVRRAEGVRDVLGPVDDRALAGRLPLHEAAEPAEHREAAMLELLHLQLLEDRRVIG